MNDFFKIALMFKAYDEVTRPVTKMAKAVDNFGKQIEKVRRIGENLRNVGERVSLAGALVSGASSKMGSALGSLVSPALSLQDALAKVRVELSLGNKNQMKVMKDTQKIQKIAIEWSKHHKASATEFTNSVYMMLSAGLKEKAAIEATKTALAVATSTMGDNVDAANLLASVYMNLGNKTADVSKEMTRIGDIIAKTQQEFKLKDLNQLSEGFKYAVSSAKQYGISLVQLSTIMGLLNSAGLEGTMAGTAFQKTLTKLIPASKKLGFEIKRTASGGVDLIGTIENIVKKYGDLKKLSDANKQAFQQAFGDEGIRTIMLLGTQLETLKKSELDIKNSAGTVARSQAIMESTLLAKMQIMKNNFDAIKTQLTQFIIPLMYKGVKAVMKITDAISNFAKQHKTLAKIGTILFAITAALLGVLGPLLSLIGGFYLLSGYGLIALSKLKNVLFTIGGGIDKAFLSFGRLFELIKARGGLLSFLDFQLLKIKYRFIEVTSSIKGFVVAQWAAFRATMAEQSGLLGLARAFAVNLLSGIRSALVAIRSFSLALLTSPITWIGVVIAGVALLIYKYWKPIKAFFKGVFEGIVAALKPFKPALKVIFEPLKFLWDILKKIVHAIASLFKPVHETTKQLKGLTNAGKTVGKVLLYIFVPPLIPLRALIYTIKHFKDIVGFLGFVFKETAHGIVSAVKWIAHEFSKLKVVWDVLKNAFSKGLHIALTPIRLFIDEIKKLFHFISHFSLHEAGKKIVKTLYAGIKSVAMMPVHAVKSIVQKIRNLLPFSPAKEGPLADLDKIKLIQTIADTIKPQPLIDKFRSVLSQIGNMATKTSLFGKVKWLFDKITTPVIPEISGRVRWLIDKIKLPEISDISKRIHWLVDKIKFPKLPDIAGRVKWLTDEIKLPSIPSLFGKVKWIGDIVSSQKEIHSFTPLEQTINAVIPHRIVAPEGGYYQLSVSFGDIVVNSQYPKQEADAVAESIEQKIKQVLRKIETEKLRRAF